ncbi:MAG: PAS domain S-box protein [Desulfobacula sp.]|jgi:PAS domain S-box-containing protein|uniref:PAS domain-containing sensor histidine kinase n=1 Tax=Desulfobacula sp. TaxID=2593537 RepID=UPI001DF5DA03|nr:PAS domain S-box protein [Desulfobacula sp.]MBT3487808.1 PAS domain S-box protein [Desulfobacula sp.]MBT3805509.1 PAS domain S-box protein [Desulfobacula sp.]MBT4025905.1 PAS domain S-box protein [Desulfobacula sp.]MBT4199133.1 PAS domain S-box protein [Desulfobacula sp.]
MNIDLKGLKIAIIGGNSPCKQILEILLGPGLKELDLKVVVIADTLTQVEGIKYAREKGLFTTLDYNQVCELSGIDVILKLKNDEILSCILEKVNTEHVSIIDLDAYRAKSFLNFLLAEEERLKIKRKIHADKVDKQEIANLFDQFTATIHKNAEEESRYLKDEREDLLEMEKELSQIIQGSMIPTFIINNEHILTHWNRACEELTGHNAYELVGTDRQWVPFRSAKRPTMADVIVGEMSEEEVSKYYGASWRKSGLINEAYEAEEFFPHLGTDGKWIFFTAAPIKSPDGKVIGAIETLKDLTQDKKTHEELELQDKELSTLYDKYKKSEEKYRSLFNNNPNPIFIIDRQTLEILDVNHRVEEEYGYTKTELLGTPFLDIGDSSDETVKEALKELPENKSILFTKKKHFKKDKSSFFVNVKAVHTTYSHRDVLIASATDITESVEKETQLIQAGKLATLGTMAAGMAHEINQPLNVIQICSDLILKMIKKGLKIPDDELVIMANDIIDNVARAAGVIKHVRDFARQSERDLKKLILNDPINDVFKVLGHQLTVHSVKVDLDLDLELPEIRAEHNRLEQVFINLVTNAIDSMDEKAEEQDSMAEKKLSIKTYVEEGWVIAEVSDTGIGMTDEVKRKIFEPFFTTKETGKGTGLGTSISFGIIKDYKGTIDIISEYGKGARFIIKFPVIG